MFNSLIKFLQKHSFLIYLLILILSLGLFIFAIFGASEKYGETYNMKEEDINTPTYSLVIEGIEEAVVESETEPIIELNKESNALDIRYADDIIMLSTVNDEVETLEQEVPPVKPEDKVEIDPEELELLATVIYCEVGGNACCDECRYRVGDVVLNRVADSRFPNDLYEVLTQKSQYGRFYWTGVVWPSRASNKNEADAVDRAYRVAEDILSGTHSDLYGEGYIWQAEVRQGKDVIDCAQCNMYYGK